MSEFIESLNNQIVTHADCPISDIVMLGDANINVLRSTPESRKLDKFLKDNNLLQLINRATRVTENSSTLIDHIYVNNSDQYAHRGILETGLSDHSLVFACRKRAKICKEKKTIFIRDYRHFNQIDFLNSIATADWHDLYNCTDIDDAVSTFNFIFTSIVNCHLPFRKIRTRIMLPG